MNAGEEGGYASILAAARRTVLTAARRRNLVGKYLEPKKKDRLPKLGHYGYMPIKMPRNRMPVAYWSHLRVFRLWCLGSYSFGTPLVKVGPLRNVLAIVDKYLQTVSHTHKQRTTYITQHPPTCTHTHSSDTTSTLVLRKSAHTHTGG